MKKLRFLLLIPLFSVNTLFILLGGCFGKHSPRCGYFTKATLHVWNNADSIPLPPSAAGVVAKAMYLELVLSDTLYYCAKYPALIAPNTAYSILFVDHIKFDTIVNVSIVSNHDFDNAHPAGSELKALFLHKDRHDSLTYGDKKEQYMLLHAPDDSGTHIFTISLQAKDPTKNITVSCDPVKLLR